MLAITFRLEGTFAGPKVVLAKDQKGALPLDQLSSIILPLWMRLSTGLAERGLAKRTKTSKNEDQRERRLARTSMCQNNENRELPIYLAEFSFAGCPQSSSAKWSTNTLFGISCKSKEIEWNRMKIEEKFEESSKWTLKCRSEKLPVYRPSSI